MKLLVDHSGHLAAQRATRTLLASLAARTGLTGAGAAAAVATYGLGPHRPPLWLMHAALALAALALWFFVYVVWPRIRPQGSDEAAGWWDRLLAGAGLLGLAAGVLGGGWGWALLACVVVLAFMAELWRLHIALARELRSPALLLVGSFAVLTALCAALLLLPAATPGAQPISFLDALFTATSAVCVTGLAVRDTSTGFSETGHAIIAVFIQLGGLGFIIFGSTLAVLFGRSFSVRESRGLSEMLGDEPVDRLRSFARFILIATIGIELAGAALMLPMWRDAADFGDRVRLSVFHSISAFCNAGFDIAPGGMAPYRSGPLLHLVVAPLIVLGGIGFPVLSNLVVAARERIRFRLAARRGGRARLDVARARLSLHTKLVLVTTAALYLYGLAAIGAGQALPRYYRTSQTVAVLPEGSLAQVALDASFMSITARTAGFNSIPMDSIEPAGIFALMTLMVVGGSPGGAAGGMKTTVFALLVLSVVATLRQRKEAEAMGRAIADSLVRKAATIAICYALLLSVSTLLLSMSEGHPLQVILFEAVSAGTTAGLSLGLTQHLTPFGKVVIIATMFLGRVGPLALFGALAFSSGVRRPYGYAHEGVALG